jgi:hypothetical protein
MQYSGVSRVDIGLEGSPQQEFGVSGCFIAVLGQESLMLCLKSEDQVAEDPAGKEKERKRLLIFWQKGTDGYMFF